MSKATGIWSRYKLRLRRKRLLWRAFRKRREISCISRKTGSIKTNDVLLFATVRDEFHRLEYFLQHYRLLGVGHFLIVDNGSTDGSAEYLSSQPDVSLWYSDASYKASRFGMDWLTGLLWRYGRGRWCVTVDADELLIYPDWETQDLHALTTWLDTHQQRSFGAMMLDLYPKGAVGDQHYTPGQDPTEVLAWFDAFGYWVQKQEKMGNLWLQGGARARYFFAETPDLAPTLNKIPLVRWDPSFVYVNSTHNALPPSVNETYDAAGTEKPTGVLLHTKFLPDVGFRSQIERNRAEHFADPAKYQSYYDQLQENPNLWHEDAQAYAGWQQLVALGLMFRGRW